MEGYVPGVYEAKVTDCAAQLHILANELRDAINQNGEISQAITYAKHRLSVIANDLTIIVNSQDFPDKHGHYVENSQQNGDNSTALLFSCLDSAKRLRDIVSAIDEGANDVCDDIKNEAKALYGLFTIELPKVIIKTRTWSATPPVADGLHTNDDLLRPTKSTSSLGKLLERWRQGNGPVGAKTKFSLHSPLHRSKSLPIP